MEIRNMSDLAKAVSQGMNTKMENGRTIEQTMRQEAERLKNMIRRNINNYLTDPANFPKVYDRTDQWMESLEQVPIKIETNGRLVTVTIGFNATMAWHDSIIHPSDQSQQGYVPWLMEQGWHSKKLEAYLHKEVYRFTRFDGIHYVKKAVEQFQASNPYKLIIEVYFENGYDGVVEKYI